MFQRTLAYKTLVCSSNLRLICGFSVKIRSLHKITTMSAHVIYKNGPGENRMQITLNFGMLSAGIQPKDFNFDRMKNEEVEKTLYRIKENLTKSVTKKLNMKLKKKKKGATQEEAPDPDLTISISHAVKCEGTDEGTDASAGQQYTEVDGLVLNSEAWIDGAVLQICDQKYDIVVNPPTVNVLVLPRQIMAGFPVFPKFEGCYLDVNKSEFVWYVEKVKPGENTESTGKKCKSKTKHTKNPEHLDWEERSVGHFYIPRPIDVGLYLKLVCFPKNDIREGLESTVYSGDEVQAGPGLCPFELRQEHTKQFAADGSFRAVSYNILADIYANQDYSREVLFPYCPCYALEADYRRPIIIKEIMGYKSDIVCLQEVDRRFFNADLLPFMDMNDYDGVLKLKAGHSSSEGCATFFRKNKFRMVAQHDLRLRESLQEDALFKDILSKVGSSTPLKEKLLEMKTILQVTVLESCEDSNRVVVVGNIHMYFHPRAQHIRLVHSLMCVRHLRRVHQQYTDQGHNAAVMFCGDFNSSPFDGVVEIMLTQQLSNKHADWYSGGIHEHISGMEISHDLDLESACGTPDYTNFVTSFQGCLDYIFVEKNALRTKSIVPMPTHQEVTQHTALPNPVFPSDHIALICDIEWI